jgi:hypothetical protein
MTQETASEVAEIGVRLLDEAYMTWCAAESECEQALHAWFTGASRNRTEAYCAYRAALDREEAAARDLEKLQQLAQSCCKGLASRDNRVVVREHGEQSTSE